MCPVIIYSCCDHPKKARRSKYHGYDHSKKTRRSAHALSFCLSSYFCIQLVVACVFVPSSLVCPRYIPLATKTTNNVTCLLQRRTFDALESNIWMYSDVSAMHRLFLHRRHAWLIFTTQALAVTLYVRESTIYRNGF